ncbi:MAG: 2-C-methyl-D-erythritol 2,4-cyclodiphosphate synthase [Spiroplasma sp.]|nr:2-C-methyl-D-erythritol 2,4-cyclodiphosphate synthase [Mycoplasmatales bacterium]
MKIRIGHSHDTHRFEDGNSIKIGGIQIPFTKKLNGHSDADVLLHAITEAIIGALGKGDIGTFFPDTDPKYKDCDSMLLLKEVITVMNIENYKINNLDTTIFAEQPMIKPYVEDMKEIITAAIDINKEQLNIKATRGEKIGYVGRGEGIAAEAVVLLIKEKND